MKTSNASSSIEIQQTLAEINSRLKAAKLGVNVQLRGTVSHWWPSYLFYSFNQISASLPTQPNPRATHRSIGRCGLAWGGAGLPTGTSVPAVA